MRHLFQRSLLLTSISLIILSLLGSVSFANSNSTQSNTSVNFLTVDKNDIKSNLLAKGQRYVPPKSEDKDDDAC